MKVDKNSERKLGKKEREAVRYKKKKTWNFF